MYGRYENTNADRKADHTRSVSIIITPRWRRAPAVDFPTTTDTRAHQTSALDSPVSPALAHELSRIFCSISIQPTAEYESASAPDTRSPLMFSQRPGPRTMGVASRDDALCG